MQKICAVLGLGSFGKQVCMTLMEKGAKVIAIDSDPALVDSVRNSVTQAIVLDATDEQALSGADLSTVDVGIVAIGSNIESSVLVTAILKQMSIPFVVARASSSLHQQVLKKVGADEIINIEVEEGIRLANRIAAPDVLDRIPISAELILAEIYLPNAFNKHPVHDLRLTEKFNLRLILIKRNRIDIDELGNPEKKEEITDPTDSTILQDDDILLVLGKNQDIDAFVDAGGNA